MVVLSCGWQTARSETRRELARSVGIQDWNPGPGPTWAPKMNLFHCNSMLHQPRSLCLRPRRNRVCGPAAVAQATKPPRVGLFLGPSWSVWVGPGPRTLMVRSGRCLLAAEVPRLVRPRAPGIPARRRPLPAGGAPRPRSARRLPVKVPFGLSRGFHGHRRSLGALAPPSPNRP